MESGELESETGGTREVFRQAIAFAKNLLGNQMKMESL